MFYFYSNTGEIVCVYDDCIEAGEFAAANPDLELVDFSDR